MSYVCQICGKVNVMGRSQRHGRGVAGKRWRKRAQTTPKLFKVNLQAVTLVINDVKKQMRICAKCLKRIRKYGSIKDYSKIAAL